jgi:hypothetical protein
MVQPNGHVSILTDTGTYFTCNSTCTSLKNWRAGNALEGTPLHAMADSAGITHVMLSQQDFSQTNVHLLHYARCVSNCETPSSWQVSPLGFVINGPIHTASLAVTPNGRVFMSYNEGSNTNLVQGSRRLIVRSCGVNNCLDLNNWTSFATGELDEGNEGSWLQTGVDESVALVSNTTFHLLVRICKQDCHLSSSWSTASSIDTSAAINEVSPLNAGECQGLWHPAGGSLIAWTSGMVIVHQPYALVKCPTDPNPSRVAPIGRIISTL